MRSAQIEAGCWGTLGYKETRLRIRRARPEEAEAITAMILRSKAHWGYSQQQLDSWRAELTLSGATIARGPVYCAEVEGRLAGVMHLKLLDAGEALLDDLFVEPDFIGAGVGAALWRQAVAVARAAGARTMALYADRHAIQFYQHMGAALADSADLEDGATVSTPLMRYTLPTLPEA